MKLAISFLLLLLSSGNLLWCNQHLKNGDYQFFVVTKVVDGDTFWIDDGSEKGLKIRLIGIDAPESRKSRNKAIGAFGKESKAFATKLLLNKKVRLEFDVGRYDRFKRTLAYVYLEDGSFVNLILIKEGYATVMTVPPNVKYADLFLKLQREAMKKQKGLWKEN